MKKANNVRNRKQIIKLLDVIDVAVKFKIHPNTVRAWVHRDGLRCYRKGKGGKMLFREDDIERFIEKFYLPNAIKGKD